MSLHASNATTAENIRIAAGDASAITQGAFTVAMLVKPGIANQTLWQGLEAGGTQRRGALLDTWHLYHIGDAAPLGFSTLTAGEWYWIIQTKAAGSNIIRWHLGHLTGGSITWTHGEAAGATAQPDFGAAAAVLSIGGTVSEGPWWNGDLAAIAAWESVLSDAEVEAAATLLAQDMFEATPQLMVLAPAASAASPLPDLMGGPGETSRSAGWTATADPAGFDFTVTVPLEALAFTATRVDDTHVSIEWDDTDPTITSGVTIVRDAGNQSATVDGSGDAPGADGYDPTTITGAAVLDENVTTSPYIDTVPSMGVYSYWINRSGA